MIEKIVNNLSSFMIQYHGLAFILFILLIVIWIGYVIYQSIKTSKKDSKWRKTLKNGDSVTFLSKYQPYKGKFIEKVGDKYKIEMIVDGVYLYEK